MYFETGSHVGRITIFHYHLWLPLSLYILGVEPRNARQALCQKSYLLIPQHTCLKECILLLLSISLR